AFTIDRWFKEELISDVLKAATGHSLIPELASEVRWLYELDTICESSTMELEFEPFGTGLKITTTMVREIRNLGSNPKPKDVGIEVDEWGVPQANSEILICDLIYRGKTTKGQAFDTKKPFKIGARTIKVEIGGSDSYQAVYKTIEYKNKNDTAYFTF